MAPIRTAPGSEYSRFAQRIRRRYGERLDLLPPGLPERAMQEQLYSTLRAQGETVGAALRITRQWVRERLLVLDCENGLLMTQVTSAMTDLAEFALCTAAAQASADLEATHGAPRTARVYLS